MEKFKNRFDLTKNFVYRFYIKTTNASNALFVVTILVGRHRKRDGHKIRKTHRILGCSHTTYSCPRGLNTNNYLNETNYKRYFSNWKCTTNIFFCFFLGWVKYRFKWPCRVRIGPAKDRNSDKNN